ESVSAASAEPEQWGAAWAASQGAARPSCQLRPRGRGPGRGRGRGKGKGRGQGRGRWLWACLPRLEVLEVVLLERRRAVRLAPPCWPLPRPLLAASRRLGLRARAMSGAPLGSRALPPPRRLLLRASSSMRPQTRL
ncbi:unnamed protein product, partial [Prorocentrum cordatum]